MSALYLAAWVIAIALGLRAYFRAESSHLDALVTSALDGPLDDAMAAACAAEKNRNFYDNQGVTR
jgi:hypothetical protein